MCFVSLWITAEVCLIHHTRGFAIGCRLGIDVVRDDFKERIGL